MKRFIIALSLACFALCGFAQEHLSFKGIPIEGSMTAFCQKLKAKGFTQISRDKNVTLLSGDFTGKNVTIGVGAADNGKDVFTVGVFFDTTDSWSTLVDTYEYYKNLYSEKYGQPVQCVEDNPSQYDSNTSLMLELRQGRVEYACIFEAPGGIILISIEKGKIFDGYVMIKYQDSRNANTRRLRELDDI